MAPVQTPVPASSVVEPRARLARVRARLHDVFGCDLRSLAALRIGLGVCVLADVVTRAQDLGSMYTDAGLLPSSSLRALEGPLVQFSLHYWTSGSLVLQGLVFAITFLLGVALIVGFHTRIVTALCWYLVASVQIRQPLAYMGGDSMLRLLLFWSLFLPMGARWSRDAAAGRVRTLPDRMLGPATAALLLQVCLMYWATGLRKDGPLWWSGRAIHYALQQDLATPIGEWLRQQVTILPTLTYATLWLELLGPCLAFIPVGTAWWRLLTIAIFWSFHVGLASAMNIGLFPLFSMVGWLAFLPTRFWTWCRSVTRGGAWPPPTIGTRVTSGAAAVLLVYVLMLVAERAHVAPRLLPRVATRIGTALRIQQTWNMFAPDPRTVASTYRLRVRRPDGSTEERRVGRTFRRRLFVAYVGADRSGDVVMQGVTDAIAALGCRETDATAAALVVTTATINDTGLDAPSTRQVADVDCEVWRQ